MIGDTTETIVDFCVSSDRRHVYSIDNSSRITRWCLKNIEPEISFPPFSKSPFAIGVNEESLILIVNQECYYLSFRGDLIARVQIPCNGLFCAAVTRDGTRVLLGRRDEKVQCVCSEFDQSIVSQTGHSSSHHIPYHLDFAAQVAWSNEVPHHTSRPTRLAIAEDKSCALSFSPHDNEVKLRVWWLATGELQGLWNDGVIPYDEFGYGFAMAVDGHFGFLAGFTPSTKVTSIVAINLKTNAMIPSQRFTINRLPPRLH